jgi:septum formation protein
MRQAVVSSGRSVDIIVGVDTVVESAGIILEKPDDAEHALRMLQSLSGGRHSVHTGVALKFMNGSIHSFHETTDIEFAAVATEVGRRQRVHTIY